MLLDEKKQAFVVQAGAAMEGMGMPRTVGRLFGLLLVAEEPLSLEDLSTLLQVSKPALSNSIKLYREVGLLRRITKPGDRRDYYEIAPGSFEEVTTRRMDAIARLSELADAGLAVVIPDGRAAERLVRMRGFYRFMAEQMATLLRTWSDLEARPDTNEP